jgi:hypothetical protein
MRCGCIASGYPVRQYSPTVGELSGHDLVCFCPLAQPCPTQTLHQVVRNVIRGTALKGPYRRTTHLTVVRGLSVPPRTTRTTTCAGSAEP